MIRNRSGLGRIGMYLALVFLMETCLTPFVFGEPVILAERTSLKVALRESLKSGLAKVGDDVIYEAREDVYGPNRELLVVKGAQAYGRVLKSKKRGMFGKAGQLEFTCEYVKGIDGTRIPLRTSELGGKGKDYRGPVIAAALLVNVLGVFIQGRDINVTKGTEFTVYIDKDTLLDPDRKQISEPSDNPDNRNNGLNGIITLIDGSTLRGTIMSLTDGKYTIIVNNKEEIIPAENVKSIDALVSEPEQEVVFELNDGQIIKGIVLDNKDGKYQVKTSLGIISIAEKDIVKKI